MDKDISGVRIQPSFIEFHDTQVNTVHKINITVKNISKTSKAIRYYGPQKKNFKLKVKNPENPVAAGLEVPAIIEFKNEDDTEVKDRLVVTVDGDVIEIPLRGYPCQPLLQLEGPVDFGNVVANSKVIAKEIPLVNHGSKAGDFKLKYDGDKPIAILPSCGTVPPKSVQIIKIEYVTKQPGRFCETAKVKLEGKEVSKLDIQGNVVDGTLELLSYHTDEPIECIKFGATYYGTDKTEGAVLYNNSPTAVSFVAVLNEDAIGQEVGVDLTQSTAATLAARGDKALQQSGQLNELTSLVAALPNQGVLGPYEKVPVFFRFSPRWNAAKYGFKCTKRAPPRQDFALFMQFQMVGASQGFNTSQQDHKSNVEGSKIEVALTGTALPVLLSLSPQSKFDFGECPVGEHVDILCNIQNESSAMPVTFQFRRVAHFTAHPPNGKVKPGQVQDVIFSFAPNQVGTFKPTQYLDVIGQVADNKNPFLMHLEVIHSVVIQFLGRSDPITVKKDPKFNDGITPLITNEVGMYVDTKISEANKTPRNAMLNAQGTKLHRLKRANKNTGKDEEEEEDTLVSFPNDRACSVRPSNREENYKTIFTRSDRHTYVDPDYAYTDGEMKAIQNHKNYYTDFIAELRENRRNKERSKEFKETNNAMDIAIKPASGLKPKKLTIEEVGPDPDAPTPPNASYKMLSTTELAAAEMDSTQRVKDGLHAVPMTTQEKADCQKILSPQQLHQVIVGPPIIDFGEVCLRSITHKRLNIVNNLDTYIHVVVTVDCRELRQTSPLSQVVPPRSQAYLPVIFESNSKSRFQRSLTYCINGFYKNHVTVLAEVVPVALQLSTDELTLEPTLGLPAEAGIRGVITLYNKLNYPAEFTWTPILGERGTAFSIRPATGTVEAFKDLDCEVVFHPSFMAPEEGQFALQVHSGNTLKLKCLANLGTPNVQFIDRRVMFGQVPLNLTTTRIAMMRNAGQTHAYFQVLDPNPFPGLSLSPLHGVVPVGGTADIQVELSPAAVMKFDTRVQVAIRGWKTLELRMGGTVEPPVVDIDVSTFNLGGVFCGSSSTTPFKLINRANTKAKIEFDLSRYRDFSLEFPGHQLPEDYTFQLVNPGYFRVAMEADEEISGNLVFHPTEVAAYDFIIPVTINQLGAPSPSPTPIPPTPAPSHKNSIQHIIHPRPIHVSVATPRKKVVATALRQPLQMSHHRVMFFYNPGYHKLGTVAGVGQSKTVVLVNNSDRVLRWCLDFSKGNQALEEGVFKFLHSSGAPFLGFGDQGVGGSLDPGQTYALGIVFCPDNPGHYEVTIPVVLDEDFERPYQFLTVVGELRAPKVWFDPLAIVLTPVPLDTEVSAEFQVMYDCYESDSSLSVEVPEVECEDGSKIKPLTVTFLSGHEIKANTTNGENGDTVPVGLPCKVVFTSPRPVSFTQPITFLDTLGNRSVLPVTATADNTMLTAYPFIAQHRSDHRIICEQGHVLKGRRTASRECENAGEAVLVPCDSPPRPASRPSTSATSSNFQISTSSYEDSSEGVTDSTSPSTLREGALNKFVTESDQQSRSRNGIASRSLGSALFPDEDSEEGIFHTEVLLAVQRWFSSQGWPGGPNPITIPNSLRSGISKKPQEEKAKNSKGGTWEANNLKKEFKTVYDMMTHLLGKPVPGIPLNNPLPKDVIERAKQVYWQHQTLLTFLRTQGACVASIKPEYLMEPKEYKWWMRFQKQLEAERLQSGISEIKVKTEEEEAIEDELFEAVSKRAWTDILLQLVKTLVLSRITPRQFKNIATPYKETSMPMVDPDPLRSNVYSIGERIVLLWLNHHYEQQRSIVWQNCTKGGIPPARWVVNFDADLLDGLVLGAVLAAHAPFLIKSHLQEMYSQPATAEQCLHNALKVVNALRYLGIDYDIQAIDITDPNPISLLLLCTHLYQKLPHYLPRSTIDFIGSLHAKVFRQVRLSNPSSKPLTYHAMLAGRDAADFSLPKGDQINVAPRGTLNVTIEFASRFLRPAEAMLVLVGRRHGSSVGSTLVFNLRTQIDNITPKATMKCESPCYELHNIGLEVANPFPQAGNFRLVLVEAKEDLPGANQATSLMKPKKKKPKKVRSKTDHGQNRPETPDDPTPAPQLIAEQTENTEETAGLMSAFYCPAHSVYIEGNSTAVVDIHFLPFQTGKRQCSVIFISEEVGEFLYSVEATATLPLPAGLPFKPSEHSVRISSAAAAGRGRGLFGGKDNVVYWKCECGQTLKETILIPIINEAKERSLVIAAQQHMSELELERRRVTGTLASGTLTAKAMSMLAADPSEMIKRSMSRDKQGITFEVELSSEYFSAPATITVPNPTVSRPKSDTSLKRSSGGLQEDGMAELPITFCSKEAGHYPCQVTLRSQDDVRVYQIECTVTPEGSEATLEFTSPVHQPVTQDIPIINETNHDWPLQASIEGTGFVGPHVMVAKAYQTTNYPLLFRPQFEGTINGKLVLTNTADGVDHVFHLQGKGERPLPLGHMVIQTTAKQTVRRVLDVPNVTKKKIYYRVESDVDFVSGAENLTVLPGHTCQYEIQVAPLRRGVYKGILAFISGGNPVKEVDSDGDEIVDSDDERDSRGYRVWYSLDIHVEAPPSEQTLELSCPCQKRIVLEVGVNNPTNREITLEAQVMGEGLSGPHDLVLKPKDRGVYELVYFPAVIGRKKGSLIFYHPAVGEFWYELSLNAEPPTPTNLPHMECELGRWTSQHIMLNNPTDETLELVPVVSNSNNFVLERDNVRPIVLRPHSMIKIPLNFMPSALGRADHDARVSFHCQQLGEWVYLVSGTGLLPQPQDPVSINSVAGSNATLIIPFRNPLDIPVIVEVRLTDKEEAMKNALDMLSLPEDSPFCLLLKNSQGIRVGPKSTLDIPISFAPEDMNMSEALCAVVVKRDDGQQWQYVPSTEEKNLLPGVKDGFLSEIRWLYPITGFPEQSATKDMTPALVECKARERVEERLEVALSGVVPSSAGPKRGIKARAVTPAGQLPRQPEGVLIGETHAKAEEFTYELIYDNPEAKEDLENCIALCLVRQHRDKMSGLVVVIFNVVYAPYRAMRHDVQLMVKAATGGIWKFPVRFTATEPDPDDVITIEAAGLNKESTIGFRVNSQARHPVPFSAFFVAGSDPEFSVSPVSGELLPVGTNGTLIKVSFNPNKYGKVYVGKLVLQAPEMQWTYSLRGLPPGYKPPRGFSARPMAGPHPDPRRRGDKTNYIRDNLKLTTTAVSSPIKGAPILPKY